jgi:hypothetical protein
LSRRQDHPLARLGIKLLEIDRVAAQMVVVILHRVLPLHAKCTPFLPRARTPWAEKPIDAIICRGDTRRVSKVFAARPNVGHVVKRYCSDRSVRHEAGCKQ